ncbi:TetR/AcrR family transcriptional regulator [bacterium]|nr:TetR/AcrR family transcriptional regulator [bacterium]
MPREFSSEDRERIRISLLREGKEQFIQYGIRKARVEEIAEAVGISKGSFYNFFRSKEELYTVIREQEEEEMKTRFITRVFPDGNVTRTSLVAFLKGALEMMGESPFLSLLMRPGELEYLLRKVSPEWLEKHRKEDRQFLLDLIKGWQDQDAVRTDLTVEQIADIITSLVAIPMQRELLGLEQYDETLTLLAEMVADGLMHKGGQS